MYIYIYIYYINIIYIYYINIILSVAVYIIHICDVRCIRDTYNKTHRSGLCAWNALEPVRAVTSWSRVCADQRIYRDNLWCLMVVDDFEWFFKGFLGFHHKKKRKSFKKWWLARGWLVPLVEDFVHNWLNAETTGFDRELRIDSQDESGSVVFIKV